MSIKTILDACCGGRTFWFDKENPNVLFIDKYPRDKGCVEARPNFECKPDQVMDFTQLEFLDKTFKMVVFDPPHLSTLGEKSYMKKKYGGLTKWWQIDIAKGFSECWRVLDDYGTLIFKWNEHEIPIGEVMKCFSQKPLFGHKSGRASKTHWMVFMKIPTGDEKEFKCSSCYEKEFPVDFSDGNLEERICSKCHCKCISIDYKSEHNTLISN